MQKDLEKWLDDVWKERVRLLAESKKQGYIKGRGASAGMEQNEGVGLIYDMYNEGGAITSSDGSHLEAMRRELVLLEAKINKAPEDQNKGFTERLLGWVATVDISALSDNFLHYRKQKAQSVHRIYINAVPATRGKLFKGILADCNLWGVDGLHNAKISSPDDGGRVDTIVIYLGTEKAVEAALGCIAAYHKANKGEFNAALPKLVVPASDNSYKMHGVGTAMEPPSFTLISTGGQFYARRKGQSFGAYRAELIFMALERTRLDVQGQTELHRKAAFKKRVEKYFRRAGIDPDKPALQMQIEALPSIWSIQDWANKTDGDIL